MPESSNDYGYLVHSLATTVSEGVPIYFVVQAGVARKGQELYWSLGGDNVTCLLYTSPSPRDATRGDRWRWNC